MIAIISSSCVKSLEDEGINVYTTFKGCVVDGTSFDPISNITVQITNGPIVYAQTTTDATGHWSLGVEINEITQDFYLYLCESAEYNSLKGHLRGFGRSEYDYKNILMTSKYAKLQTFTFGGNKYVISSDMGKMTWDRALSICGSLSESGYTNWYLPDIEEAQAMFQALHKGFAEGYRYWSSTESETHGSSAYYVYNYYTNSSYTSKSSSMSVRCVRRE